MTISYRGISLDQDASGNGLKLQLTQGFGGNQGVSVRGRDVIVPGARGRTSMPRRADVRQLLIEGWVEGYTPEDWRDATDLFNTIFDVELDPGLISVSGPYLGLGVGETWTISARVLNIIPGPIQGGMTFRHWSVELESTDPDWVSTGGS